MRGLTPNHTLIISHIYFFFNNNKKKKKKKKKEPLACLFSPPFLNSFYFFSFFVHLFSPPTISAPSCPIIHPFTLAVTYILSQHTNLSFSAAVFFFSSSLLPLGYLQICRISYKYFSVVRFLPTKGNILLNFYLYKCNIY